MTAVLAVGRLKEKAFRQLADEYLKRLSRFGKYEEIEVPDLPEREGASPAEEEKIRIPVLVCQAGKDAFVDNEGQNHFVKTAPNAKLLRFPEAKHEIYASGGQIQEQYFRALLKFYQTFI